MFSADCSGSLLPSPSCFRFLSLVRDLRERGREGDRASRERGKDQGGGEHLERKKAKRDHSIEIHLPFPTTCESALVIIIALNLEQTF